jgi:ATP-dependent Clp protease protease subunit
MKYVFTLLLPLSTLLQLTADEAVFETHSAPEVVVETQTTEPVQVVESVEANEPEEATEANADDAETAADDAETAADDAETAADDAATAAADAEEEAGERMLKQLRKERERLQLLNALAQEQMRFELLELSREKTRLEALNAVSREQLQNQLLERKQAVEVLDLEIEEATKAAQLIAVSQRVELQAELTELRMEEERLKVRNALAQQKLEETLLAMRELDAKVKMERQELDLRLARVHAENQYREATDIYRDRIPTEQVYTMDVFDGSRLVISDRRIPLNGPIWGGTADHVQQRIDYFNNQNSEYPIFIVIDYSPGGSVMAGYRILKAMEGSQAPVYVVVRSFAASMAAAITTLAEKSFAYPNAIILHHQVMWVGFGNLTQQRERLRETEEWWQRLATPIADKMGITVDAFIEQMYKKFSDGDWREFADNAVKLKWVDHIVHEITEKSIDRNPDRFDLPSAYALDLQEAVDDKGRPFVTLPRLAPFDYWHLYNPDGYYK